MGEFAGQLVERLSQEQYHKVITRLYAEWGEYVAGNQEAFLVYGQLLVKNQCDVFAQFLCDYLGKHPLSSFLGNETSAYFSVFLLQLLRLSSK